MNGKQLKKYLKSIGLPTPNISQESLESALRQKHVQTFFENLCKTCDVSNIISSVELADEKEMEELTQIPNVSDNFEPDIDEELEYYKQYISVLEKSNHDLETQLKSQLMKSNDEASEIRAREGLSKEIGDTMEHLFKMEKQASSLSACCTKLHRLIGDQHDEPVMLYQMPTELIKSSRKKFDSLVKDYILKQFEEKMLVLAGQQEPVTCSQANPRNLSHFVSGPLKQQYQEQCKEFDRLQEGYFSALYSLNLMEAKQQGLLAAIEAGETWDQKDHTTGEQSNEQKLTSELDLLESQLRNVALECSFLKVESVVIGNFRVKHRRQQYYTKHLDSLEELLKQQLALDKFLWTISKVEKLLVEEVCKFLEVTGRHVRTEVDNSIHILCKMKDLKKLSNQLDLSLSQDCAEHGENFLHGADDASHEIDMRRLLQEQTSHNSQMLRNLRARAAEHAMSRSKFVKLSSDALQSHSGNMEQLEQELKLLESKLVSLVEDFNHEMCRQTELPILKLRDKLWALFIARPDELAAISANMSTASAFSALNL